MATRYIALHKHTENNAGRNMFANTISKYTFNKQIKEWITHPSTVYPNSHIYYMK